MKEGAIFTSFRVAEKCSAFCKTLILSYLWKRAQFSWHQESLKIAGLFVMRWFIVACKSECNFHVFLGSRKMQYVL